MNENLRERVLIEISSSGFPLEIATVRDLQERHWAVSPNLHFRVGENVHEIDAFALSPVREDSIQPRGRVVGIVLTVECKRSREKPWVFFKQEHDPILGDTLLPRLQVLSELEVAPPHRLLRDARDTLLSDHHFHDTSIPVARTYFEAFKSHRQDGDIFRADTSIWHAQDFAKRWFDLNRGKYHRTRSFLLHGVIVLEAELLLAELSANGSWTVEDVNHVKLRTTDCLTSETKEPVPENEIVLDVVKSSYFKQYLHICQRNLNVFTGFLQERERAGIVIRIPQAS